MTNPYVDDIRAQPSALAALAEAGVPADVRAVLVGLDRFRRVVITGMGSSLTGTYPAARVLQAAGVPTFWEDTAELIDVAAGMLGPDDLLWVTSQSGESAEVVELLARLPPARRPRILALTNEPASTLADAADEVVLMRAGAEHTVGTKSYLNTLAAAAMLTSLALGPDQPLGGLPTAVAGYLDAWDETIAAIDGCVPDSILFVIGRGTSIATARTAALIIKEAAHRPIEAMSVPQFRHGPLDMADPAVTVLLIAGRPDDRPLNERMRQDITTTGARCVWVGPDGASPLLRHPAQAIDELRPIVEVLPFQLLSVVLAERHDHDPGRFRQIDKITRTL